MQVFISNKEIEQLAEGLVSVTCGKSPPKAVDIEAIAAYLGLPVIYERIKEEDMDKIGFVSDGVTPLAVLRDGKKIGVVFPKDTIVLERFLLEPQENARRRFVLAHEISHVVLNRADPLHTAACFNRVYDTERSYSLDELRERMNLGECQANGMAAILLMPHATMTESVKRHFRRQTIPVYGDCVFLPGMKPSMRQMANELGVSHTTLMIQLKKYNLLDYRNMSEYFAKMLKSGGAANGNTNG